MCDIASTYIIGQKANIDKFSVAIAGGIILQFNVLLHPTFG